MTTVNIDLIGVEATSQVGAFPVFHVTSVLREILFTPSPKILPSIISREILRDGSPNFHTTQVSREVLYDIFTAIFLGVKVDLAEIFYDPTAQMDFSNPANRALFHDTNLRPIGLGSDGSLPTGSPPLLYLTLQTADIVAADFPLNASGAGPMELVTRLSHSGGYGPVIPSPTD